MVSCSIYNSREEVFKSLQSFLRHRHFSLAEVNTNIFSINALHKDSIIGWKYAVSFHLNAISQTVTNIEITVNPAHPVPTADDRKKEEKIRDSLYVFF